LYLSFSFCITLKRLFSYFKTQFVSATRQVHCWEGSGIKAQPSPTIQCQSLLLVLICSPQADKPSVLRWDLCLVWIRLQESAGVHKRWYCICRVRSSLLGLMVVLSGGSETVAFASSLLYSQSFLEGRPLGSPKSLMLRGTTAVPHGDVPPHWGVV